MNVSCGDTFLIEDEEGYDCHLWIILTPVTEGEVVIVSVTTERRRSETLVKLNSGDHPFIKHPSVIAFAYSKVVTVESIETAIRNGVAKSRESASQTLLKKAQSGLLESDRTPHDVKHLYKVFMGL